MRILFHHRIASRDGQAVHMEEMIAALEKLDLSIADREFMVLSDVGEDEVLFTLDGRYAANAERAMSRASVAAPSPFTGFARQHTPGTATVAGACAALGCDAAHMLKNVLYDAVFLRAGRRVLRPVDRKSTRLNSSH